jgi:predicted negative regulator of RcsB-dependent stress response
MARHPTARRIHRETSPDDAFVEGALQTTVWVREHQRILMTGIIAVVVLGLAFLWYRNNTRRIREAAAVEILQVRQMAQTGNPALTIRDAEAFVERFGGAPAALEARLMLGQAYLESNQPDQAVEAVAEIADDLRNPSGVSAAMLTAAAHESATRFDEAERVLLRIANDAPFDYQKVAALDNAARIRVERNQPGEAVQLYDRILGILPEDSQDRPIFEMRRAEAAAAAGSTS